jgi:mutator protein MutT
MNVAAKQGFYFHHAKDGYVLMCHWMDESMPNRLPAYADHFVGVGGLVINERREVLMIQEKRAKLQGASKPWKFPGGYVDRGETICAGVEREVLEETGVKAAFQGVLAMREQMDYKYSAADFYIVCILRPVDENIAVQDTQEVENAKWIPLDAITTNEDGCEFKLYPNAFQFVTQIKSIISLSNDKVDNFQEFLKLRTLSHRTQAGFDSRANRDRIWNFYMPHEIDMGLREKL